MSAFRNLVTRSCLGMGAGVVAGIIAVSGAGSAVAQADDVLPLPDYETCLATVMGQFETLLSRSRNQPSEANFDIVERDRAEFCGTLAIVACDRSDAPAACQEALAERQVALWQEILAQVPEPAEVAGRDPIWSDGLYPRLWAVARGSSAGPDCAGADMAYEAWCVTRQASLKVAEAVMLWQVARVLGVTESAVVAGWADAPPPPMPVPRPREDR